MYKPKTILVGLAVLLVMASFISSNAITRAASLADTVNAGNEPDAVAVNPVTNKIYIANQSSDNVTVINGSDNSTATVEAGTEPHALAVNSVTNRVYVANLLSNNVTVIDGSDNSTNTVTVGDGPSSVAVNSATDKVYVANATGGTVTVINGSDNSTAAVTVGQLPTSVAVNPETNRVYVANRDSGTVTVIDGSDNNIITTVNAGDLPSVVAVNPTTNQVYVANERSDDVTVIDGGDNSIITTVSVGDSPLDKPVALAVNPETNKVYVAISNITSTVDTVTVINGGDNSTTTITVGDNPIAMAVDPATNRVYVANLFTDDVTVIDGSDDSTTTLQAGDNPAGLAVNSVTHMVYVANRNSNNVTVINGSLAVDESPPVVSITSPSDGASYDQGQSVLADYSCSDEVDGSGIATCLGDVASGAAVDTATPGDLTFTVTGTDSAGNSTTLVHNYTVAPVAGDGTAPLAILPGDDWRYFKGTAEPPADWTLDGFDDHSWEVGPSGMGYGDDDDATILSDMRGNYTSVYLRKTFSVFDPSTITRLLLSVDYDDGFVAYLNGAEVARANVAGTPPAFDARAITNHESSSGSVAHSPQTVAEFDISPFIDLLVAGDNVLALQGHNVTLGDSSDFSLIPSLLGDDVPLPQLPILPGDDWHYFKGTSEPPADWTHNGFDDHSWEVGPSGMGYGDDDDATILSDMRGNYSSVYLRKTFNLVDPGALTNLLLLVDYDDGFVAYLNGTEVARANVDGTPPAFSALANSNHEGSSGATVNFPQPVAEIDVSPFIDLLVAGDNVLALQGHNVTLGGSSDFSLIPSLIEDVTPPSILSAMGGETAVQVAFDKPLDQASAEDSANYSINNGIAVNSAALEADQVTVTLFTTPAHTSGESYTLSVTGVADLHGNIMAMTATDYQFNSGLVGHWSFDEGDGTTANDGSGNGNTGTLENGTAWVPGHLGNGVGFDGIDDLVRVVDNDSLDFGVGDDFSISLWFRDPTATPTDPAPEILEKQADSGSAFYQVRSPDLNGDLNVQVDDGPNQDSVNTTAGNLADGLWHHLVAVRDYDVGVSVYVDGVLIGSDNVRDAGSLANSADLLFGAGNTVAGTYDGELDEVRIYRRALIAGEIASLFSAS